jgi:hypothetical protein
MIRTFWLVALFVGILVALPAQAADQDAINKAVDKGETYLRSQQSPSGSWPHINMNAGATALAGLTLLEVGAKPDDLAVQRAAAFVRSEVPTLRHTYCLGCAILFLDRLGDPGDVPFIQAMAVRLLDGQNSEGGWTYECPPAPAPTTKRLQEHLAKQKDGSGQTGKAPGKLTLEDLAEDLQERVKEIEKRPERLVPLGPNNYHDNSNTQFAALGTWVGRKYGVPVDKTLSRVNARFRAIQNPDGGWDYEHYGPVGSPSTPGMTCAGLIGLALAHANAREAFEEKRPGAKAPTEISQDTTIKKALAALATTIGNPLGKGNESKVPVINKETSPRGYYFLWSLERVAVGLDMKTIGGKDWYEWGVEVLLRNQQDSGAWIGEFSDSSADTCFALLFLKRANLAKDLTVHTKGKIRDERELKGATPLKPVIEIKGFAPTDPGPEKNPPDKPKDPPDKPKDPPDKPKDPPDKPKDPPKDPPQEGSADGRKLRDDLVKAKASEQEALLKVYRESKGTAYTEALAFAIPMLNADVKRKAREALADRLTRMSADTLSTYLRDDDREIRMAAALAIAMKESKKHIPDLIDALADKDPLVVRAAKRSLQALTGQDFGPGEILTPQEQARAVAAWKAWLAKQK